MEDLKFALPGALFFALIAYLLFTTGTPFVQNTVLVALFVGAVGQFVGQDRMPVAQAFSFFLSWIAIVMTAIAIVIKIVSYL